MSAIEEPDYPVENDPQVSDLRAYAEQLGMQIAEIQTHLSDLEERIRKALDTRKLIQEIDRGVRVIAVRLGQSMEADAEAAYERISNKLQYLDRRLLAIEDLCNRALKMVQYKPRKRRAPGIKRDIQQIKRKRGKSDESGTKAKGADSQG